VGQNDRVADDDVKRFAALLRKKEADEQHARVTAQAEVDERRAKADLARQVEMARATKDQVAARLRDIRKGKASTEQIAKAEADYRAALATLLELEQGTRPAWAPAPPPPPEPDVLEVEPDPVVGEASSGVHESVVADRHAESIPVEP
jgi:multidrug efflux pump subunit AcrA (membrane-fusion protein)